MNRPTSSDAPIQAAEHRPRGKLKGWPLRGSDPLAVASLVLIGWLAVGGWWLAHGGGSGQLIELPVAQPRAARFQVDLNRADWPELTQLPGLGPKLAQRIVDYRQQHGKFRKLDELLEIDGIGPASLRELTPYVLPLDAAAAPQPPRDAP